MKNYLQIRSKLISITHQEKAVTITTPYAEELANKLSPIFTDYDFQATTLDRYFKSQETIAKKLDESVQHVSYMALYKIVGDYNLIMFEQIVRASKQDLDKLMNKLADMQGDDKIFYWKEIK